MKLHGDLMTYMFIFQVLHSTVHKHVHKLQDEKSEIHRDRVEFDKCVVQTH